MRFQMTTLPLLLFFAMSLTACAHQPPQSEAVEVTPASLDLELFEPNEEPPQPAAGATQRTAALIIEAFRESLAKCNADKETLANILLGKPE